MTNSYYLFLLCAVALITSCAKENDSDQYPVPLKLSASKTVIDPFQKIDISLTINKSDFYASYDSIKWTYSGFWDGFRIIDQSEDTESYFYNRMVKKEITNYQIGKHKVQVIGYKEGNIISQDSITYEVRMPSNDFLCLNWSTENNLSQSFKTYQTNEYNHYRDAIELQLKFFSSKNRYIILGYMPWGGKDEDEDKGLPAEIQYTRTLWHNYITQLYGQSTHLYSGEDVRETILWDEYNKRFKNKLGGDIYPWYPKSFPVEIWDTPNASICLFSVYTGWYYVIAEPK